MYIHFTPFHIATDIYTYVELIKKKRFYLEKSEI